MARESLQKRLIRVRPPRVEITYELESAGAVERRQIPFVIGVLADLSGQSRQKKPRRDKRFLEISFDNVDAVMRGIDPGLTLEIEGLQIALSFHSITDFEPDGLVRQIPSLRDSPRLLDRVLHTPAFQELERAWRSLHYLVSQSETGSNLKIKVLDVSKQELLRDFERATDFDRTFFFKEAYEAPFGSKLPEPFGVFIADYEFSAAPQDLYLLEGLSAVAAVCSAPLISGASPAFFGFADFRELIFPRQPPPLDGPAYARWRAFQSSADSRYVGLTMPRILLRAPYGGREVPEGSFQHDERAESDCEFLWGNAAFALGVCIATSFAKYFWAVSIRGLEGGGMVESLPVRLEVTEEGITMKSPVEVAMTDRREKEFADLGFIPLLAMKGTDRAVFFSIPSCHRGQSYFSEAGQRQRAPIVSIALYLGGVSILALHQDCWCWQDGQLP